MKIISELFAGEVIEISWEIIEVGSYNEKIPPHGVLGHFPVKEKSFFRRFKNDKTKVTRSLLKELKYRCGYYDGAVGVLGFLIAATIDIGGFKPAIVELNDIPLKLLEYEKITGRKAKILLNTNLISGDQNG